MLSLHQWSVYVKHMHVTTVDLDQALHRVLDAMREVWMRRVRELDLTPPQSVTLRLCAEADQPMGTVADYLLCDASTMTGIADRLEERGLIERRPSRTDRRVKLLCITESGRVVVDRLQANVSDELDGVAHLSAADRAKLAALLARAFPA
jgi:MarR family transcriptional regulator, organic hydroperoxide resistance regulator